MTGVVLAMLFSVPAWLALPAAAQTRAKIDILSLFVAEPASTIEFELRVGPAEALPKSAYVRIRGLPASAVLSEGFAVTPGVWSVPLAALADLKITVPKGVSGRSELSITLLDVDGKVLAEARSALVVAQVNLRSAIVPEPAKPEPAKPTPVKPAPAKPDPPAAPAETAKIEPAKPQPKPAPVVEAVPETRPEIRPEPRPEASAPVKAPPPLLTPEIKQRNTRMVDQGDKALSLGNVATARQFYLRAADAGDGYACLKLAETYDPAELARIKAVGMAGDSAEAKRWYERARELGVAIAAEKLARLTGR